MKTKTAILSIFLTFINLTLSADAGQIAQYTSSDTEAENIVPSPADTNEDTDDSENTDEPQELPASKYVTPQDETNTAKKDNSALYNALLAVAAVAVATVAIILVSANKGKSSNN
jgi:hypothetical protein